MRVSPRHLASLFVASLIAIAGVAFAAVRFGPVSVHRPVHGVDVTFVLSSDLEIATVEGGIRISAIVNSNMADLQAKFPEIARRIELPRDNCPGFGQHAVISLSSAQLTAEGTTAVATFRGDADFWDCQRNPIPESVCRMERVRVGPAVLDLPRCETREASPIKNRLVQQPFQIAVPMTLSTPDRHSVRIEVGRPSVSLGGQFGWLSEALLRTFGVDLNAMAERELRNALDPNMLRQTIPQDLSRFNPTIEAARFTSDNAVLGAAVRFTAIVPPDALTELLRGELLRPR